MKRRFIQCDVFSSVPARGNGLAVVLDSEGLSGEDMQRFAAWTNLAETTFLSPPSVGEADYRVRIFTTTRELPFAGHPTLGSCMAWLHAGGRPRQAGRVRQECAIGIVEVDISRERPAFVAPATRIEPLPADRLASAIAALRIEKSDIVRAALLTNGPVWEAIELKSARSVLAADATGASFPQERAVGLIGPYEAQGEADFEVRMLDVWHGIKEDPITGSLNAALARWMEAEGRLRRPLRIAQGTAIGRAGRVEIIPDPDTPGRVLIGGAVRILIEGTLEL